MLARVGLGYHLVCDWPIAQVLDDDQECALEVLEFPPVPNSPHADLTLWSSASSWTTQAWTASSP